MSEFIFDVGKDELTIKRDKLQAELDNYRADLSLYNAVKPGKYNKRQIKLLEKRAVAGSQEVRQQAKEMLSGIEVGVRLVEIQQEMDALDAQRSGSDKFHQALEQDIKAEEDE